MLQSLYGLLGWIALGIAILAGSTLVQIRLERHDPRRRRS
jgi:hypothetical protein